jgi:hypothetical protein
MYVASTKTNQYETFSPDLLQRELNSRFLQTANNYPENKNPLPPPPPPTTTTIPINKPPTTTPTIFNPLLQPYLNINQNEANLFASQSPFNPMVNIKIRIKTFLFIFFL